VPRCRSGRITPDTCSAYFTGEGTANGDQVYFGLSQGNDALHWQQLNNAKRC